MTLVLGVDSSTQSTKVEVRDTETGTRWGTGRRPHPETTPPRSEQEPAGWWEALVQAVHEAARYDVSAISVAGQQHGLVVLDGDAQVVRPAKLWNDTESAPEAAELVDRLSPEAWAAACGLVPVASFTITKLAWLRGHEPKSYARLASVLLPHDWLTWRLTGRLVTDRGDASGTGYWSPAEGRWRTDLLALVDPDRDWVEALPVVLAPNEPAGPLLPAAARPLGLEGLDVMVGPGTGDNMAAALGVGLHVGDVAVSIGTSGTVFSVSPIASADSSGAVAGFADATGRYLPLVATLNASKVTDTIARLLGCEDHAAFDRLALAGPAGAGGVVLVPYLDGERTPNRPTATGSLVGLRSDVDGSQVARAAVEGVVCGLLDGLDALHRVGAVTQGGRLVLVGGGARSAAYRRVLADLAQRPVVIPEEAEHVAVGACVQAAAVLEGVPPEAVADRWGLGRGPEVAPEIGADQAAEVRAAYAAARG
jgi:xylulokinase